jgi:hypothetical protein
MMTSKSGEMPLTARLKQARTYLPLLVGPLAVVTTVLYYQHVLRRFPDSTEKQALALQDWYTFFERVEPWMLLAVTGLYWLKAIFTRNLTYVVIGVLAGCLLLRELHWDPMIKKAIFPLLAICFIWLLLWRNIVDRPTQNWTHTVFFFSALATYFLCQLVEKKVVGGRIPIIPDYRIIHSQVEECLECSAHLLLLAAAVFGRWRRQKITIMDA